MKISNYIFIALIGLGILFGCQEGFTDEITAVAPGADESAPVVTINFPSEGTEIPSYDEVATINILFEVTDDIEVQTISVAIDGQEIANMSDFKDYRRVVEDYEYSQLTTGAHVLAITATDASGKSETTSVNFAKVPPYIPVYDGEIFYMPFNGDNLEFVSGQTPTIVGSPGFAGEGVAGGDAYQGAANSYLTFPTEGLLENELSAVFWMKVNATPDRAGVLVIGPPDEANADFPETQNLRTNGFRFFRENAGGMQRFKLNIGNGDGENWFDGGAAADVNPAIDQWVHLAFSISGTQASVYINGEVVSSGDFPGIDWTGCDIISIMSGSPRFNGWNHLSDESMMDELRMFDKALTQTEIQTIFTNEGGSVGFTPEFGEILYMPFDGDYVDLVSGGSASGVGSPGFGGEGLRGDNSYGGGTDSYLTFPSETLENAAFSASFWYKMNNDPDRAGILVLGPPDSDNADFPTTQNKRTNGFRFFRENAGGNQRFKLNVGTGAGESWFDGGAAADLDPAVATDWVHMAFTISDSEAIVYINGTIVSQGTFGGVDWTDCDILSIGSGAPRFTGWGHLSDNSYIDELRVFDRVITQTEVDAIIAAQ